MPHALVAALLVYLWLPCPAVALRIDFSGSVETVEDGSQFLDASVHGNPPVTGTYEVDLTPPDSNQPFQLGPAQLTIRFGNYQFDANPSTHAIALLDDTGPPIAPVDIWQSGLFTVPDLSPPSNPSGSFGGYSAQIQFFDFDGVVFDGSETQPIDPTDPSISSAWDLVRIELHSLDGSMNQSTAVHLQMAIPEPRSALLLVLGVASLALRERRRVRVR